MAIRYNSNYDETIPFSDVCAQVGLAAATEETWVVPGVATDKYSARFGLNDGSNVFVRLNGTAAAPALGAVTTDSYEELNPGHDGSQRYVNGGDVLHFITPDAAGAYVTVSLRQVEGRSL